MFMLRVIVDSMAIRFPLIQYLLKLFANMPLYR